MSRAKEIFDFGREFVRNPKGVGAVVPTGGDVSKKIAQIVGEAGEGRIFELGPGTGPVTSALLDYGIAPERLCLFEYSPDFTDHLRKHFPSVKVVQDDALAFESYLDKGETLAAIICAIPALNLKPVDRDRLLDVAFNRMPLGAPFIQISYSFKSPFPVDRLAVNVEKSSWYMRNLPPARVWTYRSLSQSADTQVHVNGKVAHG